MSALRLDLIVRRYPQSPKYTGSSGPGWVASTVQNQPDVDRWTWRLWSGSRIVSTSGSQLYSRRIDCARGAEVGAGLDYVIEALSDGNAMREREGVSYSVPVRILDERTGARP